MGLCPRPYGDKMRIVEWKHEKVNKKGIVEDGGAVGIKSAIKMSVGEGCGLEGCHCSDGYWIMIGLPRTKDGVVRGLTCYFQGKKEYDKFFRTHKMEGKGVSP